MSTMKIHEELSKPVWAGVDRGVYVVNRHETKVEIDLGQAVMIRQVHRLLERIAFTNEGINTQEIWEAMEPVIVCDFMEGEYIVARPGKPSITIHMTEWDCVILHRYWELLKEVEVLSS